MMLSEIETNKIDHSNLVKMFAHVSPYYCDYNATTPMPSSIIEKSNQVHLKHWFNPSASYYAADTEQNNINKLKNKISRFLPKLNDTVFCGSATEAINQIVYSLALNLGSSGQIVISDSEHAAVRKAAKRYFNERVVQISTKELIENNFSSLSLIDPNQKTVYFLQSANNETGIVNPILKIREHLGDEAYLVIDASQSFGKQENFLEVFSVVDAIVLSPHKFYGPKGLGIILWSKRLGPLAPLIEGGGQQSGLRGGTENVPAMHFLDGWISILPQLVDEYEAVRTFRNEFERTVLELNPSLISLNMKNERLFNTCAIYFPDTLADALVPALDSIGIMSSSGSACHSGTPEPSKSYLSIGLDWDKARCVVRFSFGFSNLTKSPIDLARQVVQVAQTNKS